MKTRSPAAPAFSLVELLVVIAIVALAFGFITPAVNETLRASHVATSGQMLVDQLNLARQTALSRNLPVEVRLYKLPDYNTPATSAPAVYRGLQSFLFNGTTPSPLGKAEYFSQPVICSTSAGESSLLDSGSFPEIDGTVRLAAYGTNYRYRSIVFKPDGATNLPHQPAFLTLVLENGKPLSQGANFLTVQINPGTGRVWTFRP